ncbi:7869_t:CDS:10 [Ambispora gerdemannii]|uniref:7869_t:CDS:1 n=1 Tax=Ambispora gerdemannii TaxID=144530 RepID=A0A9N9FLU5_9GLOM|nr:7869_t:CDS:10 [Ambispora gerdemannii]
MSNSPRRSPRKNKRRASTSFLFSKSTSKLESEEELQEVLKKREQRRYTIAPAKSILKTSTNSENTLTLDLTQGSNTTSKSTLKTSADAENTVTLDFTQGGTPRRKSLGRRVSFAATAQVRLFEKVTPESNPNPEAPSYISGDSDGSSSEIMNSTLLDNVGLLPRITNDNLFANLQVQDNDQGKNDLDKDSHEDSDMSFDDFNNMDNEDSDMDIDESDIDIDESDMDIDESDVNIGESDVNIDESDVNIDESDVKIDESDVNIDESDVNIDESDVNIDESEVQLNAIRESNDSLLLLNAIKEFYEKFEVFFMDQSSIPMRRQTIIPDFGEEPKLADYVNAVAVIHPQMEMYESNSVFFMEQDRSLRTKISKTESNEDHQHLLQQYLDTTPDVKELIKPRFRIIKKYCRLAAKKEWHDLRETQLEDLRKRLEDNLLTLEKDKEKAESSSKIISELLPKLRNYRQELANKLAVAQARQSEIEKCDQEQLMNMVEAVEEQNTQISKFQNDLKRVIADRDIIQQKINDLKIEMERSREKIEKAKYTVNEDKIYTKEDIKKARDYYYRLQEQYSWRPLTISPQTIEMVYDNHLYVRLDMESIIWNEEGGEMMDEQKGNESGNHEESVVLELRLESQGIKKSRELEYYEIILRCLQSTTPKYSSQIKVGKIREIFRGISAFWKKAKLFYPEIELLKRKFATEILAIRDENTEQISLCLRSSFFIKPTKFFLNFVFKYQDILSLPELHQLRWKLELEYGDFNDEIQVEISNVIRQKFENGGPKALRGACDDILKLFK